MGAADAQTIIEVGSHTELMRLDGRYAELFSLQKEGYESD
jgi:ABC-type multidrug transport system fused ATPase/permease subunit